MRRLTSNHLSSICACAHQSAADPGQIVLFWNDSPPRRAGTLLICQPQIREMRWGLTAAVTSACGTRGTRRSRVECQLWTQSGHRKSCNVCRIAMISTMWTARPTTGSPLSVFEAGTAPFDPASSCFRPFCRLDPADPFIARERRNVLPRLQRFCVGGQCPFQVRGQVMDHTA